MKIVQVETPILVAAHRLAAPALHFADHGDLRVLRPSHGLGVLDGATEKKAHTFLDGAPGQQLVDVGGSLGGDADVVFGTLEPFQQLAANFIGHALELCVAEIDAVVLAPGGLLHADRVGLLDRVAVVGGDDDIHGRQLGRGVLGRGLQHGVVSPGQEAFDHLVVAAIGLFFLGPDQMARFRLQIGTADELHAECVALLTGDLQVAGQRGRRGTKVSLVRAVEDGAAGGLGVTVLLVLHDPGLDARLHGLFLGIDQKANTSRDGQIADFLNGRVHQRRWRRFLLKKAKSIGAHASESGELVRGMSS